MPGPLVDGIMLLRVRSVVGNLPVPPGLYFSGYIHRRLGPDTLLAQDHERRVDANPGEPGGKAGPSVKLPQMLEGAQHGILQSILRVLTILGNAVDGAEGAFRATCAQFDEGPLLARLRRSNQPCVAHRVKLDVEVDCVLRYFAIHQDASGKNDLILGGSPGNSFKI